MWMSRSLTYRNQVCSCTIATQLLKVVFQLVSRVQLFVNSWTATRQASLSCTISRSSLRLRFNELMMPFNRLVICHRLLLLPLIFPISRVFSNELARHIRWPNYWNLTSVSVLPMNIELISLRID